jgi:hypothetical protein
MAKLSGVINDKTKIAVYEQVFKADHWPTAPEQPRDFIPLDRWGRKVVAAIWSPADSVASVVAFSAFYVEPADPNGIRLRISRRPGYGDYIRVRVLVFYEQ